MFFEKLREVGGKKLNGFDKWVCFMLKVHEIYANICSSLLQSFVLCGCFLTSYVYWVIVVHKILI